MRQLWLRLELRREGLGLSRYDLSCCCRGFVHACVQFIVSRSIAAIIMTAAFVPKTRREYLQEAGQISEVRHTNNIFIGLAKTIDIYSI